MREHRRFGQAACCARAAIGHVVDAPPRAFSLDHLVGNCD
jgi:hypothetical protein